MPHGVGLIDILSVAVQHTELVFFSGLNPRYKQLIDPGILQKTHGVCRFIPVIERTDHRHGPGIRCPHRKTDSLYAIHLTHMRSQNGRKVFVNPVDKEIPVHGVDPGLLRVGIQQLLRLLPRDAQAAAALAAIGKGDQAVDAVGQRALAAAGGPRDQDLLAAAHRQIDVMECRLGLGVVLKAEMFKLDDDVVHKKKRAAARAAPTILFTSLPSGCPSWAWRRHRRRTGACPRRPW